MVVWVACVWRSRFGMFTPPLMRSFLSFYCYSLHTLSQHNTTQHKPWHTLVGLSSDLRRRSKSVDTGTPYWCGRVELLCGRLLRLYVTIGRARDVARRPCGGGDPHRRGVRSTDVYVPSRSATDHGLLCGVSIKEYVRYDCMGRWDYLYHPSRLNLSHHGTLLFFGCMLSSNRQTRNVRLEK